MGFFRFFQSCHFGYLFRGSNARPYFGILAGVDTVERSQLITAKSYAFNIQFKPLRDRYSGFQRTHPSQPEHWVSYRQRPHPVH